MKRPNQQAYFAMTKEPKVGEDSGDGYAVALPDTLDEYERQMDSYLGNVFAKEAPELVNMLEQELFEPEEGELSDG